jgi:nucleotide-binding universal stress UspA family protein
MDFDEDRVLVLMVIDAEPHPLASVENKADYETELMTSAKEVSEAVTNRLNNAGVDATSTVEHGHAGKVICETAEREDVDEIVMGRRGRGTATELLLGSTSRYVIHHTDRPITVVPPADD